MPPNPSSEAMFDDVSSGALLDGARDSGCQYRKLAFTGYAACARMGRMLAVKEGVGLEVGEEDWTARRGEGLQDMVVEDVGKLRGIAVDAESIVLGSEGRVELIDGSILVEKGRRDLTRRGYSYLRPQTHRP